MRGWLAALLIASALAGCLDATGTGLDGPQPIAKDFVGGQVMTPAFNPIHGATLVLENPEAILDDGTVTPGTALIETRTDAEGRFSLASYPGTHRLTVAHPEYDPITLNVTVPGDNLTLFLSPVARIVPFQEPYPFDGYIECAAEAGIITPSCDTASTTLGGPGAFRDDSVFTVEMGDEWQTIILDVWFDKASHPGIAGMRASAYGADASAEVFDYERIHQEWGEGPFTLRLEPGVDYAGDTITPTGAGKIRFEFFPHGHADDTVCNPQDGVCFLGVGFTQALSFEAIATIFYHEAAPEGWSLLPS